MTLRSLGPLFLVITLSACTSTRLGSATMASTKNLGCTFTPIQQHVRGEDCAYNVLGIPLGSVNPNLQEAVDNAVSPIPGGDMMTNVTVHRDLLITLLYNQACVRVEGDVVNSSSVASAVGPRVAQDTSKASVASPRVEHRQPSGNSHVGPAPDRDGWVEVR